MLIIIATRDSEQSKHNYVVYYKSATSCQTRGSVSYDVGCVNTRLSGKGAQLIRSCDIKEMFFTAVLSLPGQLAAEQQAHTMD